MVGTHHVAKKIHVLVAWVQRRRTAQAQGLVQIGAHGVLVVAAEALLAGLGVQQQAAAVAVDGGQLGLAHIGIKAGRVAHVQNSNTDGQTPTAHTDYRTNRTWLLA
jgi:hypothetical protein